MRETDRDRFEREREAEKERDRERDRVNQIVIKEARHGAKWRKREKQLK